MPNKNKKEKVSRWGRGGVVGPRGEAMGRRPRGEEEPRQSVAGCGGAAAASGARRRGGRQGEPGEGRLPAFPWEPGTGEGAAPGGA